MIFQGGFEINLDHRKLKTPQAKLFTVPSEALAVAVATEWDSQQDTIKFYTMHLVTSSAPQLVPAAGFLGFPAQTGLLSRQREGPFGGGGASHTCLPECAKRSPVAWSPTVPLLRTLLDGWSSLLSGQRSYSPTTQLFISYHGSCSFVSSALT